MGLVDKMFFYEYDLAATTYVYSKITPQCQGYGGVKTVGSSTTLTAVTAGIGTFSPLAVGDIIVLNVGETPNIRKVATVTSPDSIVLSAVIDLTVPTAAWYFRKVFTGTGLTEGFHTMDSYENVNVWIEFATELASDGLDVSIEVKRSGMAGAIPVQILEKHYATGASTPVDGEPIVIGETPYALRVGLKATLDFTGTDAITVGWTGSPVSR